MSIKVRFKFRTPRKNNKGIHQNPQGERSLYIRLRVNGVEAKVDYASGVWVHPTLWDQKHQCTVGRGLGAQAVNDRIEAIRAEHKTILNRQISLGIVPNAETIKREWIEGITPPPSLLKTYSNYITYLSSLTDSEALAKDTLEIWEYGQDHLKAYLAYRGQRDMQLRDMTLQFGKEFHSWLMSEKKHAAGTASRYLRNLEAVLMNAYHSHYIDRNPFDGHKWPKGKLKPVYFLEDEHILALESLKLPADVSHYRDLCLLMAFTGLDYPDLVLFLNNPQCYIAHTKSGKKKIVGLREKTEIGFQIPLLPEAESLVERHARKKLPHANTINRYLRTYEAAIGWTGEKITVKILRKTAGGLFLNAGYSMEFVSKLLGHASIKTTQKHYAHLTNKRIDNEIDHVGLSLLMRKSSNK